MTTTHSCAIESFQHAFNRLIVYEAWTERHGPWDWRVAKDTGDLRCPVNHADSVTTMNDVAHSFNDGSLRLLALDLNEHGLTMLSPFNAALLSVLLDSQAFDIAKVDVRDCIIIAAEAHPASIVPHDVCQGLCGRSLASFHVPFPSAVASTSPVSTIVLWKKDHRAYLVGPKKSSDALSEARRNPRASRLGCRTVLVLAHRVATLYRAERPNPTVVADLLEVAMDANDLNLVTTVVATLETFTSNVAVLVQRSRRLLQIFGWTALRSSFAALFSRRLTSWDDATTALSWTCALVTTDATGNADELLQMAWSAMGHRFVGLRGSLQSLTNLLHHALFLNHETEKRTHSHPTVLCWLQQTLPDDMVDHVTRFLPKRNAAPDAAWAVLLDAHFYSAHATLTRLLPLLSTTAEMYPTLRLGPCIAHVIKALAYMVTLPDALYDAVTPHLDVLGPRVVPGLLKLASRHLLKGRMLGYVERTLATQTHYHVAAPRDVLRFLTQRHPDLTYAYVDAFVQSAATHQRSVGPVLRQLTRAVGPRQALLCNIRKADERHGSQPISAH